MTIRTRLTLLYSALLGLALLVFSLTLYEVLRWTYIQTVDETLQRVAAQVGLFYQQRGVLPRLDSLSDRSTFVQVRLEESAVAQSGNFSGLFPLPAGARSGQAVFTTEVDSEGEEYRLLTVPATQGGRTVFYVQAGHTLKLLNFATERMRWPLFGTALLFLALGAMAAWLVANRALQPIHTVARAARAVGESSDLSLRVPAAGAPDEVGDLVRTFNDMLDQLQALYARLAAAMDAQQRFVADASHELRTPLTIIRGNIDYLRKAGQPDPEALADMASEAERMTRLVEELLTMARADAGQAPELTPVALGPLVAEACRKAQALPHEAQLRTELPEALDRVTVLAHAEWLSRVLLILVDNAFKYTPAGSVTVRAGRQGDGVVIQVADTGVGIAREDLPHIFERFYRADRARSRGGAGLGLAIARWISGLHGGHLSAESELGKGSTFSLWLPVHRGSGGA